MFHNKYGYSIFLFDSKQEDMEKAIIPLATIIKILKRFKETMLKTVVLSNCKKYS
ncbi:hypothetical protein IKS57_01190 [bacterium]|nr:hypothetical protein [bacterium]